MAIDIHIATIVLKPVKPDGTVLNKNRASIKDMLQQSSEARILEDAANAPNSVGFPSIIEYLKLEAAAGFSLKHMTQTMIVHEK